MYRHVRQQRRDGVIVARQPSPEQRKLAKTLGLELPPGTTSAQAIMLINAQPATKDQLKLAKELDLSLREGVTFAEARILLQEATAKSNLAIIAAMGIKPNDFVRLGSQLLLIRHITADGRVRFQPVAFERVHGKLKVVPEGAALLRYAYRIRDAKICNP